MRAYLALQVEIMMALEEKFDLTLDEEGTCHTRHINLACLVMHTSQHVLFNTAFKLA